MLMKSRLTDVPAAIKAFPARHCVIYTKNLFWAFIYNVIGIPLTAGGIYSARAYSNPMFGAAAMSLSSFCVVSECIKARTSAGLYSTKHDRKQSRWGIILIQPSDTAVTKTIKIKGMMCENARHVRATRGYSAGGKRFRRAIQTVSQCG